jgi:hypothetical protein
MDIAKTAEVLLRLLALGLTVPLVACAGRLPGEVTGGRHF